jgi:dTDP-4-dehydrorhamnose reductase
MKIVIIGSGGRLGSALMHAYEKDHQVRGFSHSEIDVSDFDEVEQLLTPLECDVMINCAAMTNVDLCEEQRVEAFSVNADAPELLAEIAAGKGARFIHFSTDYVFDGSKRTPYTEEDEPGPTSIYGESKLEGEENVLNVADGNLVVRVSWVFGPERPSFIDNIIQRARDSEQVGAVADKFSSPTYTADIAAMLPRFFPAEVGGILHFANTGECSWLQYGQHALDCCWNLGVHLKTRTLRAITLADMPNFVARRPVYTALSTARFADITWQSPRPWQDAVSEYVKLHYSPN